MAATIRELLPYRTPKEVAARLKRHAAVQVKTGGGKATRPPARRAVEERGRPQA